ncbi:MAG: flavodoxin family protein [bacterium]
MKVLAVLGSPREQGNTRIMAREMLAAAQEAGAKTEAIYLNDLHITPCQACLGCRGEDAQGCIYDDDMQPLYAKIRESKVLVLATPVYWWGISAQLKTFIDRWYAFGREKYRDLVGKKVVLVVAYGGNDPILAGAGLVTRTVQDICNYVGMEFVGVVHLSAREEGEVLEKPEIIAQARQLGREVVGDQ